MSEFVPRIQIEEDDGEYVFTLLWPDGDTSIIRSDHNTPDWITEFVRAGLDAIGGKPSGGLMLHGVLALAEAMIREVLNRENIHIVFERNGISYVKMTSLQIGCRYDLLP